MLDRHMQKSFERSTSPLFISRELKFFNPGIEFLANSMVVLNHCRDRRPFFWCVRRQPPADRVDPESEKLVQFWCEWLQASVVYAQEVPVKRFQMAQGKNYTMAF